jgi:hypothetical protein
MLGPGPARRLSALALAASLVPTTWPGTRTDDRGPGCPQAAADPLHKNMARIGGLLLAVLDATLTAG